MRLLDAIFATLKSIVDDDIFSDIVVMWHSLINSEEVTQFRVMQSCQLLRFWRSSYAFQP